MNIWIITIGEPLPIDPGNERLLRTGLLCPILVERAHTVTWWTSDFNHVLKQHRFGRDHVERVGENYSIRLAHACGYSRNVSPSRLLDHWQIARVFRREAETLERPDLILASYPTIEHCAEAIRYGERHGVPVVIDVRDLWPDIFTQLAPAPVRPVAEAVLRPYFTTAREALHAADAIFAITDGILEWGLKRADRDRRAHDRAFPMGYPSRPPDKPQQARAFEFWRERGVSSDDGTFKAIFMGTIGRQVQLEPVVQAAKTLGPDYRFIICGTGDRMSELEAVARDVPNVMLPGWVGADEIWALMRLAQVGLAPYHDEMSFTKSLPNKSIEYLSAGLPIVSSLPGTLQRLLAEHECGLTYRNRDAAGLADCLRRIRTAGLRERMAANSARLFDARFRVEAVYADMAAELEAIAQEHRPKQVF